MGLPKLKLGLGGILLLLLLALWDQGLSLVLGKGEKKCPQWSQNADGTATRCLIMNPCGEGGLPLRFRTTSDPFPPKWIQYGAEFGQVHGPVPSLAGYTLARMSGSAQFCLDSRTRGLLKFLADGVSDVVLVNLRMESQGFLGEKPVSYFCPHNWDLLHTDPASLSMLEEQDFAMLAQSGPETVRLFHKVSGTEELQALPSTSLFLPHRQSEIKTERQAMRELGVRYVRIPIPDHRRPRDGEVQALIDLFRRYPKTWLHFHCKMGKGRTTTAMIMRDIFLNAHLVSLRDIMLRNYVISGVNLENWAKLQGSYKLPYAQERIAFLHAFYQFVLSGLDSWQEFLDRQLTAQLAPGHHAKLSLPLLVETEKASQPPAGSSPERLAA